MSEKDLSQDSISLSNSSNKFSSESLLQNINYCKNNNLFIISKIFEQKIPDILSFLQNNFNLAINKISIIKYLQNLFSIINMNSEIFLRKYSSDKKLNLYQIIIEQYISYTNSSNFIKDENDYRKELLVLFEILLSQVTMNRESYHHILSFLLKYINEKNDNLNIIKKEEEEKGEKEFHLSTEHLTRILKLIKTFYQFIDKSKISLNFFFFSGESDSSVIIHNKNSIKDNKKLLNLDDNLCILMFIKVFPSEYIKAIYSKKISTLLELKFNEKYKEKDISIDIDEDNNLTTSFINGSIAKLSEKDTNWLLIKFKKKKRIKVKIYLNGRKIYYQKEKEKEKDKDKEEIKEIILFKNFIGICYNFMIFKTKKKEVLPKFLENEANKNKLELSYNIEKDENKKDTLIPLNRTIYYNGFISEELIYPFSKPAFKDEIDINTLNTFSNDNNYYINNNEIKDFKEKILAIYIPTRVLIPSSCNKYNLQNTPKLILQDSINGLDAVLITKNPSLNGLHIYKRMTDDFEPIGGLNNLLPILEIMIKYTEFLTKENLRFFFDILISIFVPHYQKALFKEKNSNFFLYLSYFLEKIPDSLYDNSVIGTFKSITSFLTTQINEKNDFIVFLEQFHNHILMNEIILFKFNYEEQKDIFNIISNIIENLDIDKKSLNIDIIKMIKILIHLDENKNIFFCCKKHSEYFNDNYGIMNPELYIRLKPIEKLLTILFNEFEEKVKINDSKIKDSNNLYKLFTLLTYDISPCIQKMIIRVFSTILERNFNKCFDILDQDEQILNISLFILKTSIFEIKKDILNLIFIILKNRNINIDISQKNIFISNYILPFYLFADNELLQIISSENNKNKNESNFQDIMNNEGFEILNKEEIIKYQSTINKKEINSSEDNHENIEEKDEILNINDECSKGQDIYNEIYGENIFNNSKNILNGLKESTNINGIKYSLPVLSENKIKIYSIYNKIKLRSLINDLFNIIYKYFHEETLITLSLNLLIKIVSKGDILLVSRFLEKLQQETSDIKNKKKIDEIYDNHNLLHWLIETCFQASLIKSSNLDHTTFVPGFNINISTSDNEGNEKKLDNKEIMELINNIIKISKKLLNHIFNKNIYKMDYIFTWSKYYYELRNEKNNFKSVRELILEFMIEIVYNACQDCTNPDINNLQQKKTIYFFNLLFEFVTYYKLKEEDLKEYQKNNNIDNYYMIQELSKNLKYILVSKMEDCRSSLRPIIVQEKIDSKFEEYPFFKSIFDSWSPLWKNENKQIRQESDIYNKYINNKKNININELEILFYNFSDIKEFNDSSTKNLYVNKGIPLIYILYHFFILIFSIGGNETEIRELFIDFRLFILLLIISSSTLSASGKKKKFPSDEQYKNVQLTIEAILFNFLSFLYNKIKATKNKINSFNEREQNLDDDEKKYLNYLYEINILLVENLGYFLKIINRIYREIKKEDENNNIMGIEAVNNFFKGIKSLFVEYEGVKNSGGFKLIEKMYSQCSNLSSNQNEKNFLDEIAELNFNNKGFLLNSKSTVKDNEENTLFVKLEKYINSFIEDSQIEKFFENNSESYKKILYPFIPYIFARREAIKTIIPIFDNRPNITFYQKELCLIPDYFPENSFDSILIKNIESVNNALNRDLQLNQKKYQIDKQYKSHNYKKVKKNLFRFTRIWSFKDFFYNKKEYRLKYKLLNHLSEDFTRVLLTPIMDIEYYLPQFSKFNPENIFRNLPEYKSICKATDLSFDLKKRPFQIDEKKDKKEKKNINNNNSPLNCSKNNEVNKTQNLIPNFKENKEEKKEEENQNKINEKEEKDKNALYYMSKENFSFLNEKEKREDVIHKHLFSIFIKKKHFDDEDSNSLQANACLIRLDFHIRGIIFNNDKGIGFYSFESKRNGDEEDYDSDRKVCFGSIFRLQAEKYSNYYLFIPYNKIQLILKRRYYFKKTALEIFTEDKKSYLFRLDETLIKYFIENIIYYMKDDLEDIFIEYNKFDEKIGFVNKNNIFLNTKLYLLTNEKKFMNLKTLYEKWIKWEISTLRILMIMNLYSNRTYNDINQYPVFPWIITDYESSTIPNFEKEFFIRPMNKPMGMMDFTQESKERKENYEEHWRTSEEDEIKDENYDRYGSHYSTSLYLTYYLVRVFPFSYIRIELQGSSFDDPNRLFNSLPNSFDCATTQKSDLRELIPEFFCFPEMFLNINELNLGQIKDQKGNPKLVEEVEMPNWANNNPYNFIEKHRELLESSEINEKINEWFNIIFGSKQKGKEGKKIGNLFLKQTYEDFEEVYKNSSKSEKIFQLRMVEFGVTPHQIFKNDTNKRQNINDCNRVKRNLLFNILQKKNKKNELTGKEWDLEEIKINIDENYFKMFNIFTTKKDKKKERLYLLTNNKVKIYTKYDKNQFFKNPLKEKEKENIKTKEEENEGKNEEKNEVKNEAKNEENKEEEKKYINNINKGEQILIEKDEIKEENKKENDIDLYNTYTILEKENENEMKIPLKEQSKININFKYDKKFVLPKYRMNFMECQTILYDDGFHIAFGGFWNGDIILRQLIEDKNNIKKNTNKKVNIIRTCELSPITRILINKTDTISICCNIEGTIFIYIIDQNDKLIWKIHKIIKEGLGELSSMAINENLNIFIICFKNCYNMLYTLPNCKLFNSFRIEENDFNNRKTNKENSEQNIDKQANSFIPITSSNNIYCPNITFISQSPLPCFVFYIKERKSLCVYSINACFLNEFVLGYEIIENGIKKFTDHFFKDYLFIYNTINNTIDVHALVDLNLVISSPIINYQFIDFQFTKDSDYAVILVKDKQKNKDDKSQVHKMLLLKQTST